MPVHEYVHTDRAELFREAAKAVFSAIGDVKSGPCVLGLCGGRSIGGILQCMFDKRAELSAPSWRNLQFFMVDERIVPLEHPDSNFGLVQKQFFSAALEAGLIESSQLHPFVAGDKRDDYGTDAYEGELERFGGRFHIVFLGAGEDGHVAGAFPGGSWIGLERGFVAFEGSPKPPPLRMTATPSLIAESDFALGMFFGEDKRQAFENFHNPQLTIDQCPAKVLAEVRRALILTDLT